MNWRFLAVLFWCISTMLYAQGIGTIVVEKSVSGAKKAWDVYSDATMENVIGSINPGDSIRVLSWAPWVYMIRGNSITGYISWRAVHVTGALRKTAWELERKSDSLTRIAAIADSLQKYKNLHYWLPVLDADVLSESWKTVNDLALPSDQSAFLRLYASDVDIDVGECTTVNLSFYVSDFNTQRLQFYDLADQISKMQEGPLDQSGSWYGDGRLSDVTFKSVKINGVGFTEYRLFSRAYCPIEAKPIEFTAVQLSLVKIDRKTKKETPVEFASKPFKINVSPAANAGSTTVDFFNLTGKFVITDSVYTRRPGLPVTYTMTLKGKGISYPLQPPALTGKNFSAEFVSATDADTILNNVYYSSKTFTWKLFLKDGVHKLWLQPVFSAYNPGSRQVEPILLNREVTIEPGKANDGVAPKRSARNHLILLDVSQSMMIEDYPPNRLGMAKNAVNDFLTKRAVCDVGLIVFSGNAVPFDISTADECYSGAKIGKIDFLQYGSRGTAIGDAVWLAAHSINLDAAVKKIVIIGDGENTAGYTNITRAISLANKYKIAVYTIGIGQGALVPFGRDQNGNPIRIHSNFTDVTLKKIAEQTGGKYFHAESKADVTRLLKEILPE